MRLLFCFYLFSLCGINSIFAQFIAAGQYGPNQYFVDIQPDTTIQALGSLFPEHAIYPLDMNGDSVFDYELHVSNTGGLGSHSYRCYIEPKNDSQVAISYTDSCFGTPGGCLDGLVWVYGMARAFEYGEQIDTNAQWADSLLYLSYFDYIGGCYWCDSQTFAAADTNYIGVRFFTPADTVYGWIKVSGVTYSTCTIEALASASGKTATKDGQPYKISVQVYPNPSSGLLRFHFDQTLPVRAMLSVWDNMARPVLQQEIEAGRHTFSPDATLFPSGVYYFSIRMEAGETVTGKFVVAN